MLVELCTLPGYQLRRVAIQPTLQTYTRFKKLGVAGKKRLKKVLADFRINRSITEAEVGFPRLRAGGFIFRVHPALFRIAPIFSFSVMAMILCSVPFTSILTVSLHCPYCSYVTVMIYVLIANMLRPREIKK